jgi:leucyl aminopeptidase (aminopeptidase T)
MTFSVEEIARVMQTPLKLNTKEGDKIFVITDTKIDPVLWQGFSKAAKEMGREVAVGIMEPRVTHATNPMSAIHRAALDPELDLIVYLTSTAMAHAKINEELIDNGKRHLLMEELTPAMLSPDGPAGADYAAMNEVGLRIAKIFTEGETCHVTCPNGTNLTAGIKGRPGRSIAGVPVQLKPGGGGGCAFPDGEAHVCPVEGTGNGTVVFDLTAHSVGAIKEPMRLTVVNGFVTKIEGGREAAIWRDILEKYGDANSYNCPAEISIGLNPKVTPTGVMRTDKKMYATSHIGIGDTVALGGTCHAKLRLEGVIRKPEISVDGKTLTRDGKILV